MITALILTTGALAGSTDGMDNELSLEVGSFGADEQWTAFSSSAQMGTVGVRAGYALSPNLTIVAGWHRGRHGGSLIVETYDDGDYLYNEIGLDFTGHQLTLGPKVDYQLTHWLRPYATVQALGFFGKIRLDEDTSDDELQRFRAQTFGGIGALGIDLVPGSPRRTVHPASYLELGYGHAFSMNFEDSDAGNEPAPIGSMGFSGLYLRWGVGVRF